MELLVTHLTRMKGNRICVAGLDSEGRHVRPEASGLTRDLVPGLFQLGAVVDLGSSHRRPKPPQVENVRFNLHQARRIDTVAEAELAERLRNVAKADLAGVFGSALARWSEGRAVPCVHRGTGDASLGCVIVAAHDVALVRRYGTLRAEWIDSALGAVSLAVTDLRWFPHEDEPCPDESFEELQSLVGEVDELSLAVGLGRPFAPEQGHPPMHWLQVNNIHALPRSSVAIPSGWAVHSVERLEALTRHYPDVIARHPRAWALWTAVEDDAVRAAWAAGATVEQLVTSHQRKRGAIVSRLQHLGLMAR